jgi:hypothetical protein
MNNRSLIDSGLALLPQIKLDQTAVASATTVVQQLYQAPRLVAYLFASRPTAATAAHANLVAIVRRIADSFDERELRDLYFTLQMEYADLPGASRQDKVRELALYMQRHGRLPELLDQLQQLRPHLQWETTPMQAGAYAIEARLNLAVVVEYARPALQDAARYLDDHDVTANVVYMRHPQPGAFLSEQESWVSLLQGIGLVLNEAKQRFSGAQRHFFLSAPGALLFGLGCLWGTVDDAEVYHYQANTFHPVLPVTRALRQPPA